MSPLRIVHLIGELGYGGSERQLYLLAKHLRDGFTHQVVVFNPGPSSYHQALAEVGAPVWRAPAGTLRRSLFVRRVLHQQSAHVVHSWTTHDNAYAAVCGRLAATPLRIGSLRGALDTPALRALHPVARHLCLRAVDRLVVNASCLRDDLVRARVPRERVVVVPNVVEPPDRGAATDLRSELGRGAHTPLVGLVANLRPVKDHFLFLAAVSAVFTRQPRAHAVLVGQPLPSEAEYARAVRDAIERSPAAGRIHLLGFRADARALIAQLDVLCLTSTTEGTPNTVLEALAHSRPVVATAVGGVPDLVRDGENGFLVPRHLARADAIALLAARLERLLADPALRASLGHSGARFVADRHAPAAAAASFAAIYRLTSEPEQRAA